MAFDREKYYDILSKFVPKQALDYIILLLQQEPVYLKITRQRKTKHGDFKAGIGRQNTITVNHNLNKYAFLITFLHEMAHLKVYKKYIRKRKPHGKEWKEEFKELMKPMLETHVFPEEIHDLFVAHMKNPKASTSSDIALVKALRIYDFPTNTLTLDDLEIGDLFTIHGKKFKLGEKRRTRFMCKELNTNKLYTINQLAEVTKIDKNTKYE